MTQGNKKREIERDSWNMVKMSNKDIQSPGRKGQNEAKRHWLKISKLTKNLKPSIQGALQIPGRVAVKKSAKLILRKLWTPKKIVKATRGKTTALLQEEQRVSDSWHFNENSGSHKILERHLQRAQSKAESTQNSPSEK